MPDRVNVNGEPLAPQMHRARPIRLKNGALLTPLYGAQIVRRGGFVSAGAAEYRETTPQPARLGGDAHGSGS